MAGTSRLKTIGRARRVPPGKDPFENYKVLIGPEHDYFFNQLKPTKRTPTRAKREVPAKRARKENSLDTSLLSDQEKLLVNKKKVDEVREWIESRINEEVQGRMCLLISGPPGCGKTNTLRTLCTELDFDVAEWETFADLEEGEPFSRSHSSITETDLFTDFISNDGSKCIVSGGRTRRMKLIKEIPNFLIRNPQRLQNVFKDTIPYSNFITIFLLTTIEGNYELCLRRYLPPQFLKDLNIHHVNFNPISTTAMRTYVKELVGKSNGKISDQIVETSNGDLRNAMVMSNLYNKNSGKVGSGFFNKPDTFVQFLNYIGKVLYAKRLDKTPEWTKAQTSMGIELNPDHRRDKPPKENIVNLLRICPTKCETIIDYVSEHELPLFKAYLPRVARVYDDLCHVITMFNEFEHKNDPVVNELGTEIIIASTMFNNYTNGENRTQYKITKPQTRAPTKRSQGSRLDVMNMM